MERARRKFGDALECRPVEVGHFHECEDGGDAEDALDEVDKEHGGDCRANHDVHGARDKRLVEGDDTHAVTQQEHDAYCACKPHDTRDDGPDELDAVTDAYERGGEDGKHAEHGDRRGEAYTKIIRQDFMPS